MLLWTQYVKSPYEDESADRGRVQKHTWNRLGRIWKHIVDRIKKEFKKDVIFAG